jgi:hypothetical protein
MPNKCPCRLLKRMHLCFIGRCALYTVIHCVAGKPRRIFFFGPWSSSASSASRGRFCPTLTPSMRIGRCGAGPHSGSNSRIKVSYFGSSSNLRFTTDSVNC